MNRPLLKWSGAQPSRVPDNIISSGAREKKQLGFTPSYNNDSTQHMHFLMSNEYMKIWFKERARYEKDIYTREQIIKEESKIKRRICQRMMTYRKPPKNQFIEDMIPKPKEMEEIEKYRYDRHKYKPACQKKKADKNVIGNKGARTSKESKEAKEGETEIEDIVICTHIDNDCEEDKS